MIGRRATFTLIAFLTTHDLSAQQLTSSELSVPLVTPVWVDEGATEAGTDAGETTEAAKATETAETTEAQAPSAGPPGEQRACDGCPPRRLGTSFLQVTLVNVVYELANLMRGQVTAEITPKTWWTNMKRGWEWDLDDFVVNQIGHPYQGNNYFTAGRANGLSFWESSAITAFGSGTWEYFGETNQASLNDFINTTLGGIALGEMFHRAAWLVRDTRATGKPRLRREIAATVIDPLTGLNRFLSGDASRVVEKPPDMIPSSLGSMTSAGVQWRGSGTEDEDSTTDPFVEVDMLYGDLTRGYSRTPYDAFMVRLAFGGGNAISEARVRGRLLGQPYRNDSIQFTVTQGYQYNENDAYQFGAQSFEGNVGIVRNLTPRLSLWALGWGGVTILGAVDSMPLPGAEQVPGEVEEEDAGQGVSVGPRYYDYGPGTNFGGLVNLQRDGRRFVTVSYEAHHLHVLDGVRANHLLQRARADFNAPIRGSLGFGVTAEFFDRRTFYQVPGVSTARFHYPQFGAFLTWGAS